MKTKNTFKIIFALLATVTLSSTFISCGDDDDKKITEKSIWGK